MGKTDEAPRTDVYTRITNRIIADLEEGVRWCPESFAKSFWLSGARPWLKRLVVHWSSAAKSPC